MIRYAHASTANFISGLIMFKFKSILFALLLLLGAVLYTGWGESLYWRQKFILEVNTPSGMVISETVLQYRAASIPKRLNRPQTGWFGIYGEAPFVKLPNGRYLFALSLYGVYDIPKAYAELFGLNLNGIYSIRDLYPRIKASSDVLEMERHQWPLFITFDDINDPSTVRQVDPRNLAKTFGAGFRLKRFAVKPTVEPATYGRIRRIAEWMIYSNQDFNPSYKGINEEGKEIGSFNRSVLARTINCKLDAFLVNNMTYGFRSKGLFCSY